MDQLVQAANLNKLGVSLSSTGDHLAALKIFRKASSLLRDDDPFEPIFSKHSSKCFKLLRIIPVSQLQASKQKKLSLRQTTEESNPGNKTYMLSKTFQFSSKCLTHVNKTTLSAYRAAVVFNLALSYHQQGEAGHDQKALGMALDLYEICLEMVLQCPQFMLQYTSSLLAATANNIAQIYWERHDMEKTKAILEQLRKVMHDATFGADDFEEADIDIFILNVFCQTTPLAGAAAA